MANYKDLFTEFEAVSKSQWEQQVIKELKGRAKKELEWGITSDWQLPPFYHPEDNVQSIGPILAGKVNNDWEIGEDIWVEDIELANKAALQALKNGVESICFVLNKNIDSLATLEQLMDAIKPSYISVYFKLMESDGLIDLATYWKEYIGGLDVDAAEIKGGIDVDLFEASNSIDLKKIETIKSFAKTFPNFHFLSSDFQIYEKDLDGQMETMALTLAKGSEYLNVWSKSDSDGDSQPAPFIFNIEIGNSYLVEIAKLRAFQMMWTQILEAYGHKDYALINASLSAGAYGEDPYSNMIRATAMGMSAVLGGVNRLTILPANATKETPNDFTRRVARNLQHLFKMESYLDRVIDPAAGSYYLEELTQKIGARVWKRFQEIEKGGGYLQLT